MHNESLFMVTVYTAKKENEAQNIGTVKALTQRSGSFVFDRTHWIHTIENISA